MTLATDIAAMESPSLLHSALALLSEDTPSQSPPNIATLIERITALLATNPARLMHILYRIDVNEEHVEEIFATTPPDQIATELTHLILKRLELKHHLRMRYTQSK